MKCDACDGSDATCVWCEGTGAYPPEHPPRWTGQLEKEHRAVCDDCGRYIEVDYDRDWLLGLCDHFDDNNMAPCAGSGRPPGSVRDVLWWKLTDGSIVCGVPYWDGIDSLDEGYWDVLPWGVQVPWRDGIHRCWGVPPNWFLKDGSLVWS